MNQQLVLKSKNALTNFSNTPDYAAYKQRVELDGGVIYDTQATLEAYMFIYQNNINEGDVLSATSVSWGVKYDATTKVITKLYNLFSGAGDIVIQNGTMKAALSTAIDNKPSLYAGGSNSLFGTSSGVFNNIQNLTLHTIYHIPVLASYGAGAETLFPIQQLVNKSEFDASTDSAKIISNYTSAFHRLIRASTSQNDPLLWKESHKSYGGAVGVDGNLYTSKAGYASIVKNTGFDVYKDGVVSNFSNDTAAGTSTQKNNQRLYFLTHLLNSGSQIPTYFVGYIFENWVLNNSTADIAKALSLRAKTKYRS